LGGRYQLSLPQYQMARRVSRFFYALGVSMQETTGFLEQEKKAGVTG
jgi:hypothetical protein